VTLQLGTFHRSTHVTRALRDREVHISNCLVTNAHLPREWAHIYDRSCSILVHDLKTNDFESADVIPENDPPIGAFSVKDDLSAQIVLPSVAFEQIWFAAEAAGKIDQEICIELRFTKDKALVTGISLYEEMCTAEKGSKVHPVVEELQSIQKRLKDLGTGLIPYIAIGGIFWLIYSFIQKF
jgi:hypothetical protein